MELLLENKIIYLGLALRHVYKKSNVQPVVNSSENEHVYRMPGLLGDAREYMIERFYRNENSEDDSE
ncbi:unnamed protein product [Rotaria sordida]|uniref:E3 ubiquitin ligase UBR4 C-terminal domain-containing protein n=1 Tax=Rotaria sordida TaxID=392033 RepID=A0A816AK28_9BILA|nr:unnamed protein product [Rotaria sordida]